MSRSLTKLSAVALAAAILAGCATGAEEEPNDIVVVREEAAQALAVAREAQAQSAAALAAAQEAKQIALDAQGLAKAAQFSADRNAQRLEQMFKKSMYK